MAKFIKKITVYADDVLLLRAEVCPLIGPDCWECEVKREAVDSLTIGQGRIAGGVIDNLQRYLPQDPGLRRFDLEAHLQRQRDFSEHAFGPGDRLKGVTDHIRKELDEVTRAAEAGEPTLPEWIDVVILALDGAWRSGATPRQIIEALVAKQAKNEARRWPDWRTADPDKAIEHDRAADEPVTRQEVAEAAGAFMENTKR
jgi:hypothetical protein